MLKKIILQKIEETQKNAPPNFNTENWLRDRAKITVRKLLNSKYPKKPFRIEYKTRWLRDEKAISIYFRIPDLYPTDNEESFQNFETYTKNTIRLENLSIHPFFQKKSFFKWLIYYLRKSDQYHFIHIANVMNIEWRDYFYSKTQSDPTYKLASYINKNRLIPIRGEFDFVIFLNNRS